MKPTRIPEFSIVHTKLNLIYYTHNMGELNQRRQFILQHQLFSDGQNHLWPPGEAPWTADTFHDFFCNILGMLSTQASYNSLELMRLGIKLKCLIMWIFNKKKLGVLAYWHLTLSKELWFLCEIWIMWKAAVALP